MSFASTNRNNRFNIIYIFRIMKNQIEITDSNVQALVRESASVKIAGTVSAAPELRVLAGGKTLATCLMLTFETEVADNGVEMRKKVWRQLVAWGKTAEFLKRNFSVGRKVIVDCTERNRSYVDANGKQKMAHEFLVNRVLHMSAEKKTAVRLSGDC